MEKNKVNKSRRSFIVKGTTALGAGLVSTGAGAVALFDSPQTQLQINELKQKLNNMEDKETLKQMHFTFINLLENRTYDAVINLFADDAVVELSGTSLAGKAAVKNLFLEEYKNRKISSLHTAYRRNKSQTLDQVTVSDDRKHADASFYNQVLICNPIRWHSALADMARQQGMSAQSYWENGRYDISFTRMHDQWQISKLSYHKV